MNNIQTEIDRAFTLLGTILVISNDAEKIVDIKTHLRTAFSLAEKLVPKEESDNGGQNDRGTQTS